ncbi:MAG: tetratricopeptide repeat protein [Salinisphaera sp.]|nr:tetratricopeptide repeat protein [Salinisphaera sp.]
MAAALLLLAGCATTPSGPGGQQPSPESGTAGGLTTSQRTQFGQGANALRAGNADQAARIFAALTKAAPKLAAAWANLGTARMMQKQDAKATAALEKAVALNPGLTQAQVRLGVLYRRAGKFPQAEAAYKAALSAQPDNRYAHLNLGILYDVYLHRPAQALSQYQQFQALLPQPDDEVAIWIADLKQRL